MERLMLGALLVCIAVPVAGCAGKKTPPITAETLMGRWRAVTKPDADEGNARRDVRTPTGETVAFRYDFRADHSFEMSVEITGGLTSKLTPQLAGKRGTRGTWKVLTVEGSTMTVELTTSQLAGANVQPSPIKVVFKSKDQCLFDAESEEAMMLTRLEDK
jgi:hypothetical protein